MDDYLQSRPHGYFEYSGTDYLGQHPLDNRGFFPFSGDIYEDFFLPSFDTHPAVENHNHVQTGQAGMNSSYVLPSPYRPAGYPCLNPSDYWPGSTNPLEGLPHYQPLTFQPHSQDQPLYTSLNCSKGFQTVPSNFSLGASGEGTSELANLLSNVRHSVPSPLGFRRVALGDHQQEMRALVAQSVSNRTADSTATVPTSSAQPVVLQPNTIIHVPMSVLQTDKVPISKLKTSNEVFVPSATIKRKGHNLTEARYRTRLNGKIERLKELLCGSHIKKTKSEILLKALDYIENAEKDTPKLRKKIICLEEKLAAREATIRALEARIHFLESGTCIIHSELDSLPLDVTIVNEVAYSSEITPPSSVSSNSGSEAVNLAVSPPEESVNKKLDKISTFVKRKQERKEDAEEYKRTIHDRSRMLLCAMMFSVLFFNPVQYLFGDSMTQRPLSEAFYGNVRSTVGVPDDREGLSPGGNSQWIIWVFNLVLVLGILIRLYVYGEPVLRPNTEAAVRFWSLSRKADLDIARGDSMAALRNMSLAFEACGRPLPNGHLDIFASLCWQSVRHMLHHLVIGNWLEKVVRFSLDSDEPHRLEIVQKSARDAAVLYHKLHRIYVTGVPKWERFLGGLNLALSAVNLAEAAGDALPADLFMEMYAAIALEMKRSLPNPIWRSISYTLNRARRLCRKTYGDIPSGWHWLFHPLTLKFFHEYHITFEDHHSSITLLQATDDPVAYFARAFREHALKSLLKLHERISFAGRTNAKEDMDDFIRRVDVVIECSSYGDVDWSPLENRGALLRDNRAQWWAALLGTSVASGSNRNYHTPLQKYAEILSTPPCSSSSERVTSAVLACYKAAFSSEPDHPANAHVKLEALAYAYKQFGMVMPNVMKTNDRFSLTGLSIAARWMLDSLVNSCYCMPTADDTVLQLYRSTYQHVFADFLQLAQVGGFCGMQVKDYQSQLQCVVRVSHCTGDS